MRNVTLIEIVRHFGLMDSCSPSLTRRGLGGGLDEGKSNDGYTTSAKVPLWSPLAGGRAGLRLKLFCLAILLTLTVLSPAHAQTNQDVAQPIISGPLTLNDAVQTALRYSPMVQSAGDQLSAAHARVGMSRAMTRPQLSATVFGGTSTMGDIIASPPNVMPSGLFTVPDKANVSGQAGLMFPLYTGGRLSSAIRGSEALSAVASSDLASVKQNTSLETKTTYHRALLAKSTVDVYKDLVKEAQERVRIAEATYREGKIAKYDLLRNQTGLAEAEQQLANAERDEQIAYIDLKTVLGVSPSSSITLVDQLTYSATTGVPDKYMTLAMKNRPELTAAQEKIASAQASLDIVASTYKPQIYANAMEGVSSTSDGTNTGFTVGISVGLPILDGGLRRSAVREAESMLAMARRDRQQAVLRVQQDVNTVLIEIGAADRIVHLSEAAVTQAEEDYRVIRLRYESGKAVNVEVLDALASLVRARNNKLMALYEYNIAGDRLARAVGEL